MTTTTDTLTRWIALWEQDETLRPDRMVHKPAGAYGGTRETMWIDDLRGHGVGDDLAAALIRDSAVRWLAERAQEPCIMPDGSLTLEASFGAKFGGPFAGPLSDALYEACKAVLGEDTI